MTINKSDLIDQLVEKQHYTKKAATQLVDDFTDIILENLLNGNPVSIHNFGTFDLQLRAERVTKHPTSGERVIIPAHWIPRFFPARKMRANVKLWEDSQRRGLNK